MRYLILFIATTLFAQFPLTEMPKNGEPKIAVQNTILAKVNGTTISMIDVKKKMDLFFHQNYPHLANNTQARFQFYDTSWRKMLSEMIDHELILADAADKEVKVTDGEIREEIESRFGPNVMSTLDQVGLTYDEAWKLTKNDMVVQRMNWWFIHSKALAKVTPQEIKQGFRKHLETHPAFTEWKYRVLTIRDCGNTSIPEALHAAIANMPIDKVEAYLQEFGAKNSCVVSLSNEYTAKETELADSHRSALSPLAPRQYSSPGLAVTKDKSQVYRIFYLSEKLDHPAAAFEEMAPMIKNELLQKAVVETSQTYLGKLRKHYRFEENNLRETLPADLHPFSLQ
jgi:hypothetical protein